MTTQNEERQAQLAALTQLINLSLPGHDLKTFSELSPEIAEQVDKMIKGVHFLVALDNKPFSWNMSTVELCEALLDSNYRPRVKMKAKGRSISIAEVRESSDSKAWSKDPHAIAVVGSVISQIGVVFGQALAQMYGAKWHYDPVAEMLSVKHDDWHLYAVQKPLKYLTNGGEDSLVGLAQALQHKAANDSMRAQVKAHIDAQSPGLLDDCHAQDWHDEGRITSTHWIDSTGKTVLISAYTQVRAA